MRNIGIAKRVALPLLVVLAAAAAAQQSGCNPREREAYLLEISQAVVAVWKVPTRSRTIECMVTIQQNFRGEVLNATVMNCGDDPVINKSLVDAAYRASPLPLPADKACFNREISTVVRALAQGSG